jgi:6-phosphogluconate dehydrogenase (decarboxylating)
MNEDTDATELAELLRDTAPAALLWQAGDDLSAALLELAEQACRMGAPRPQVVAVGGTPDGDWTIVRVNDKPEIASVLAKAALERLLCARPEDIPGAVQLPTALLSALVWRAKNRISDDMEADALFDRMRTLGYL